MKIISACDKLSASNSRSDLIGAIAAGVCAGAVRSLIHALHHQLTLWAYVRWTILAIAAYFAVATLLQRFWRGVIERSVPTWVLTALLGSIIFVAVVLTSGVIKGWYDPSRVDSSLIGYILTEAKATGSVVIVLSLITLPVTATFHHARDITRAAKDWHTGSEPPSILRRQ
jgi:hypothetical protein